ncbi:MAG: bifunctional precorrin-2 dehydrogenase/sirohydrochlorin ferrochelatase [Anaerolineae bacterium]
MKTYPIALVHLDRQRCVIVGGGAVAARKVGGLRAAGAQVTVISPRLCPAMEEHAAMGSVEVLRRGYRPGDLEGAFVAIAATDDEQVNQQVWEEAQAGNILVNVVDDPDHCTFIAPAVVRRGPLTLAISTGGASPALSRHLRQQLEGTFGPEYATYVTLLGEIRQRSHGSVPAKRRRALWDHLLASDVLDLVLAGDEVAARRRAEEILRQHASPEAGE